jgi:hypothetical protein
MRLVELFNNRSLLSEKRRAGGLAPKRSTVEELSKYAGQTDVFVSYVSDVGVASHGNKLRADTAFKGGVSSKKGAHNVRGTKFGINPKSQYDTPIGIYSYPVDYVIKEKGVVPFAGNEPYIQVFRAGGKILDLSTYSRADMRADVEKIQTIMDHQGLHIRIDVDRAERHALVQSTAGAFWNVTRIAAMYLTNIANGVHGNPDARDFVEIKYGEDDDEDEEYEDDFVPDDDEDDDWEDHDDEAEEDEYTSESVIVEAAKATVRAQWSKLFRALGYSGVVDPTDRGIIHENEPTQAVFFSKENLRVLEVVDNRADVQSERGYVQIYSENPGMFMRDLKAGKVAAGLAEDVMKKNLSSMPHLIPFDILPKGTQEFFEKHWIEFVYFGYIGLIRWMPMTDEKLVALLKQHPDSLEKFLHAEIVRPGVLAYLNENATKFAYYFDKVPFSTEALITIMKNDPSYIGKVIGQNHHGRAANDELVDWAMTHDIQAFTREVMAFGSRSPQNISPKLLYKYFVMSYKSEADTGMNWSRFLTTLMNHNIKAFDMAFKSLPMRDAATYAEYFEQHMSYKHMIELRPGIPAYIEKHGIRR